MNTLRTFFQPLAIGVIIVSITACQSAAPIDEKIELRSRVALAEELLEVADFASSVCLEGVAQAVLNKDMPLKIALAERTLTDVTSTVTALALTSNPEEGLIRLYVWTRLAEFACQNRMALINTSTFVINNCDTVFVPIRERVDELADRILAADVRKHLHSLVEKYKVSHPDLLSAGPIRIDDLATEKGRTDMVIENAQSSMMAPVSNAAEQLERTRILGSQLVWLLARAPRRLAENADATVRVLLESDRAQEAMAHAGSAIDAMHGTASSLNNLKAQHELLTLRLNELSGGIERLGDEVRSPSAASGIIQQLLWGVGAIVLTAVAIVAAAALWIMKSR